MKVFKKIALGVVALLTLSLIGGYVYFDRKFSPPENDLHVLGSTSFVPIQWESSGDNPYSALLLPVKLEGIESLLFMQLDFGSPSTIFYRRTLESVAAMEGVKSLPDLSAKQVALSFELGEMQLSSPTFRLIDYGQSLEQDNREVPVIIGTIGTDLLERRTIELDFKSGQCTFLESELGEEEAAFQFKKRRILLPARFDGEQLKLLYDSGTSGYEFITDKDSWDRIRNQEAEIRVESGNSWGKELQVLSAPAKATLALGGTQLGLSEVTYISGTSGLQNLLMRSSGMDGMIGNKLFLGHKITLDCQNERFRIE